MKYLYRVGGIVASLNSELQRIAYNGLSLSWILLLGAALFAFVSLNRLIEGHDLGRNVPMALASGSILLLIGHATARHNIVFRPEDSNSLVPSWPTIGEPIQLNVCGRFDFDDARKSDRELFWDKLLYGTSKRRWFLDVPSILLLTPTDDLQFRSNIDASIRAFGVLPLDQRSGQWIATMKRDEAMQVESGELYLGLKKWPALRIHGNDNKGKATAMVATFDDDLKRNAVMGYLLNSIVAK
jgi:hypothetical protein